MEVSRLGFGCVKLTTHRARREAVRILEQAFVLGITHFDVARAYGFGRAEYILGEFLRGKRDRVTVATKFGLVPPSGLPGNRWIIDFTKKVLGPFPKLLRRAKERGATMGQAGAFSPEAAVRSLETSLRALGTDYVDIFLLHEATLADAASEPLMETLQSQIAKGKVRCIGIASDFRKLSGDVGLLSGAYQVVQFNDNAQTRNLKNLADGHERSLITHSIFQPANALREAIAAHPEIAEQFSFRVDAELRDPEVIGSLLLHYALRSNTEGAVLFSTSDPKRLAANMRDAESRGYSDAQLSRFVAFVDEILKARS
jgi:aryl-alcohol dehydrogenase-like predicted oxidoreductase